MFKKGSIAVCNSNNRLFGCYVGKRCEVVKHYFYNGESWLKLIDAETNKQFESPAIFWD